MFTYSSVRYIRLSDTTRLYNYELHKCVLANTVKISLKQLSAYSLPQLICLSEVHLSCHKIFCRHNHSKLLAHSVNLYLCELFSFDVIAKLCQLNFT
jgi:hypothetical protein